jgi:hypothetical protein
MMRIQRLLCPYQNRTMGITNNAYLQQLQILAPSATSLGRTIFRAGAIEALKFGFGIGFAIGFALTLAFGDGRVVNAIGFGTPSMFSAMSGDAKHGAAFILPAPCAGPGLTGAIS